MTAKETPEPIDLQEHNRKYGTAYGTALDRANIEFSKIVYDLRQDWDIHCLLGVNWPKISVHGYGKLFFAQVRHRVLDSIVLGICKIYEQENWHELNSLGGLLRRLREDNPQTLNLPPIEEFVHNYGSGPRSDSLLSDLELVVRELMERHSAHLQQFKTARDKVIAHSEYDAIVRAVPLYDVMETLFFFAADFYSLITSPFIGGSPDDLSRNRGVKVSLMNVLRQLIAEDLEENI